MKFLMILSAFCYFLGMVKFFLHMAARRKIFFFLATAMVIIGFVLHTAMLFALSYETGHGPYTTPFEQVSFFAWTTMGVLIASILYFRISSIGVFVSPIGFLLMFYSFLLPSGGTPTVPTKEFWLTMHFTLSFLALSSFALMFAASIMYLLQERQLKRHSITNRLGRMPDLDTLDTIFYGSLIFGFPLVTVGIGSAILWSKSHYDMFFGPEPARVLPLLLVWVLCAVLITGRLLFGWRGHGIALLGVIGFAVAMAALGIHVF